MLLKGLLCFIAMVLCACAQTDAFERPGLPVPTVWPLEPQPLGAQSAAQTHWRNYFADPRLQALIAAALQNNRDLRVAVARVEEARAQYKIVRSDRLPSVNLLGTGSVGSTPPELSGTGATINGQRYDLALSAVSYEFDFWGRVASLSESARNTYLATEEATRAFQLSLVADVASSYFVQLQLSDMLRLASQAVGSREMTLAVIGKGRAIGAAYDFEYEQAQGALEGLRAELESLEHQRTVATNRLNYLVGATLTDLPQGLDLDHQGLTARLAPGLPAEVLLQRPDVMAAEQRLRAAHANIGAARAAFLPKIALTAGLGVASQGLSTLFNGLAWNFLPSITLPLFNDGRLAAGVDVAEARKVIAVAEYERTIQLAFREVADLLSAREALARQLRSAQLNEASQNRRLEIALARYNGGLVNVLEVLDGERSLVSAQQNTVQLRRAQLDTAAQLYKALGGGA
jgi:multidrug efflux system outer membrane protein